MSLDFLLEDGYTMDQVLLAKASTKAFVTTFFKNPNDPNVDETDLTKGESWKPYGPQKQLYNLLDFGYDIDNAHFHPKVPAEIIVMIWPRQRGKTAGSASAACGLAIRYPNSNIGIVSASEEAAKDFISRVKRFLLYSPFQKMIKTPERSDRVRLNNGSSIISYPTSEKAIRGKSLRWLFMDEAAIIPDKLMDEAAFPTVDMVGAFTKWKTPSIVLLSTPQGPVGRFYDYYVQGLENREVGCYSCGYRRRVQHADFHQMQFPSRLLPADIPPCPKCGADTFEYIPNEVITITLDPYDHPTKTKEQIDAILAVRGNTPAARQEYLGEILMDESGVFSRSWLEECTDPKLQNYVDVKKDYRYVIGMDFGKVHDATVFSVGHIEDNLIIQDYLQIIPSEGGIEYSEIRFHFINLINRYEPAWVVPDATGIGGPVVEQMDNDIRDLQTIGVFGSYKDNGVDVPYEFRPNPRIYTRIYNNKPPKHLGFVFDYNSKIDLIDNLSNLFQRRLIRIHHEYAHPSITIQWKELINFGWEYSNNNRIIFGTQRDHDDTVIAIALMAWGCRETPWYNVEAVMGEEDDFVL